MARCPHRTHECERSPELLERGDGHFAACCNPGSSMG
jgi:hypothetical protein